MSCLVLIHPHIGLIQQAIDLIGNRGRIAPERKADLNWPIFRSKPHL